MKKGTKRAVVGVVLIGAVGGGAYYWYQGRGEEKKGPPPQIVEVKRGDLRVAVSATGVVEPEFVVEIKPKASGEVEKVFVEEGDHVKKGKLLVVIDPIVEKRRVAQALSEVRMATARAGSAWHKRKFTIAQLERERELLKKGLVSGEAVARLEKEAAVLAGDGMLASAQLAKAKEALKEAQDRLSETKIMSPADATILRRSVQPGQVVASGTNSVSGGTTLLTLANLKQLYVRVKIDEADVAKVRPGMKTTITADGLPGRRFGGKVLRVAPKGTIESNVTVFDVIVAADEKGSRELKPQMSANVEIIVATRKGALLISQRAVRAVRRRRRTVHLVTLADGKRREVKIGYTASGRAEVLSGLTEGDKIQIPTLRSRAGGRRGNRQGGGRNMRRMMRGR